MSTKTVLTILIIAAIIVIGFIVLRGPAEAPIEPLGEEEESVSNEVPAPGSEGTPEMVVTGENATQVITYTDSGYSPSPITIKAGDTVTWRNQSSRTMWTASAIHPTHKVYPGSDIQKCGSGEVIFDACQGIAPGAEWSFTFTNAGTWGYHNHLQASHTGKVIVE